jgi:hypothetical protein
MRQGQSPFAVTAICSAFLPFRCEFPEIIPKPGEVAPGVSGFGFCGVGREHFRSKLGSPEGDFIEVAVGSAQVSALLAGLTLAIRFLITERCEKRFPVFLRFSVESVSIEFHEGREKRA